MRLDFNEKLDIPKGVDVKIEHGVIRVKGPKGEVSRKLVNPKIHIEMSSNEIKLRSAKGSKREKTMIYTFKAHIKNMLKGVVEPFVYKLKICSTHFPITAAVAKDEFSVQNFLGEKVPRRFKIAKGVTIKVQGAEVTVESADLEAAGMTASAIEQLCRIADRDRRIFQDGIFITSKAQ